MGRAREIRDPLRSEERAGEIHDPDLRADLTARKNVVVRLVFLRMRSAVDPIGSFLLHQPGSVLKFLLFRNIQ